MNQILHLENDQTAPSSATNENLGSHAAGIDNPYRPFVDIPPRVLTHINNESQVHQQSLDLFNNLVTAFANHMRTHDLERYFENEQPYMLRNTTEYVRQRMAIMIDLHMCKFILIFFLNYFL